MTTLATEPVDPSRLPPVPRRAGRSEVGKFVRTGALFLLGLALAAGLADMGVGRWISFKHGLNLVPHRYLVGWDVYHTLWRAHRRDGRVTTVVMGDSVARQLFRPNHEPNDQVRFFTSNQAISMAGQYYLLRDVLKSCPNTKQIYFFYYPGSLENDLGPAFTHDYFCGYFHTPVEIAEVFGVKRNFSILSSQLGRCLVPNLMLFNSASRPVTPFRAASPPDKPAPGGFEQLASDREPILDLANVLGRPPATVPPRVGARRPARPGGRDVQHHAAVPPEDPRPLPLARRHAAPAALPLLRRRPVRGTSTRSTTPASSSSRTKSSPTAFTCSSRTSSR